jgi:hypothetical protein
MYLYQKFVDQHLVLLLIAPSCVLCPALQMEGGSALWNPKLKCGTRPQVIQINGV